MEVSGLLWWQIARRGLVKVIVNNNNSSSGIGFLGLLTILFIALKLTGYVDWSWWLVLSPIWGGFLFASFVIGGAVVSVAAVEVIRKKSRDVRRRQLEDLRK
jgi:hypothetical protein